MKAISPVLPSSPEMPEVVYAKDQPQYLQLPACNFQYTGGEVSVISRYRLTIFERLKLLFTGSIWLEQMTFGQALQPQRPTINEPLTDSDRAEPKPNFLSALRGLRARNSAA